MTGRGRPLRFLALLAVAWISVRIVLLWPPAELLPDALEAVIPNAAADIPPIRIAIPRTRPAMRIGPATVVTQSTARSSSSRSHPDLVSSTEPIPTPRATFQRTTGESGSTLQSAPRTLPGTFAPLPDRWSASAWLVARPGTGIGAAPGASQLGGSQAGATIAYMLVPKARLAAFARVTGPLRGAGSEAAIGVQWQPSRAPVRIVAERRFGLDGTPGGTGLGLIAGIDTTVPADFRLEAYGQAGAIHRNRTEPYADGAARVTRTIAASGDIRLALGAGVWGAAQREAARLDIGPSATLSLPRGLRVALDWRQRVAGRARPGSGPALTLGGDF